MTNLTDLMHFAAYCHSAEADAEELAFQKKLAEKTLEQFGVKDSLTLFADQGFYPTSQERPGLQRLLEAVDGHQFDCVVINEWSQIATSVDEIQSLMRRLDSRGVVVMHARIEPALVMRTRP